ncbi:sugar ABC transporter substrate-binding protein [Naasia sp. SYSU D00057]|uniref:ABC transporter substrate-binding protein n=1 Tax=Naasia sp. SYSU D00057 TaxID=2817380 RepID=UPI001B30B41D|nr:sugar ABC transporter substrate-binding protein [Naasia sp. SYSU D00057]
MKKRSSRRLIPLAAAITVLSLTACGGQSGSSAGQGSGPVEDPEQEVTISFASWIGESDEMAQIKKAFEKEHPTIKVELRAVPADSMTQTLTTQIAGNNPPDVAFVDASTVAAFASRGALVNLDNYISRSDVVDPDDYVDVFRTFATFEDSMYGLPIDGESTALFYRTDMFEAAGIDGPPTTWEELEETAAKLTQPDKKQYGLAMFAPESAYYWYPFLWQNGGNVLDDEGKPVFDSLEAQEAAEYYVGLTDYAAPDYLNSNSYDARLGFFQGQMGMYIAGAWFAGVIAEEAPDLEGKWATANLPEGEAGCATTVASDSLVLFEGSDNTDAGWQWIEYLSQPENMALLTYGSPNGTLLPTTESLLDSPELLEKKPQLEGFAEAMKCGVSNVQVNEVWPQMEAELNTQLGLAMYGEIEVDEALANAKAEAEKLLR